MGEILGNLVALALLLAIPFVLLYLSERRKARK